MPQPRHKQHDHTPTWSARTVFRYTLFQLPGIVLVALLLVILRQWGVLPTRWCWGIMALWLIKEAMLFPLVWRAYDPDLQSASDMMIGAIGVTRQRLAPTGYIRVRGVLWRAEVEGGGPPVDVGKPVKVEARQGLTLIVVPEQNASHH